jgi:hypothetical protein
LVVKLGDRFSSSAIFFCLSMANLG